MERLDQREIESRLFTLIIFITLSLPSLKLIYSSSILNLGLMVIYSVAMVHFFIYDGIQLNRPQKVFILLFLAFFSFLFLSYFIFPYSHMSLGNYVKYGFVIISVLTVATFVERVKVPLLINLMIGWGVLLCIWKLSIGISLNSSSGQTYLTYGMPIGCSFLLLLIRILVKNSMKMNILLYLSIFINLLTILTSRGRSSIIFPVVAFFIVLLAVFFNKEFRKRASIILMGSFGLFLILGSYVLANLEKFKSLARVIELAQTGGEDERWDIWTPAIQFIKENPLGYGTDSYDLLLIHYPHNIFLEIGLSFGVIGISLFVGILFLVFLRFRKNMKRDVYYVSLSAIGLYFFLSWNTSHDLATATIPFVSFALSLRS